MSEPLVIYSVRRQAGEIQQAKERLRALVEKATGIPARVDVTLLDGGTAIVRAVAGAETVPDYLSTTEAAKLLGCSSDTVRLRCAEGALEHRREGRVLKVARQSIERYLGGGR